MSVEQNKELVTQYLERVWGQGEVSQIGEFLAPAYLDHTQNHNVEEVKQVIGMYRQAFPDLSFTLDELVATENSVALRYTTIGTNFGPFMRMPPTGKKVSAPAMVFYHISNGKITESWGITDSMAMMQQMGLMPSPSSQH